ncbi:MAG: NAD(P)-dependent oxidoreductase [Candidatus Aenigmarchaeota archaeon]|nr:NAD(P)-dependent oxidoreductase [Candidatus Aenigmarchaeota archaeon]
MKILITGGTGFLGSRLVKALVKKSHKVAILSRLKDTRLERIGAKFVLGSVLDLDAVTSAVRGKDIVYHLAANLNESDPDMYSTNVIGTQNVVEACKKYKVKRIILSSSIGVLGHADKPAIEEMPYNPSTKYEKSKTDAEKIVRKGKVPFTIMRTTIILGPNRFWEQIIHAAEKNYPLVGSGSNFWHIVYIDDAVDALLLATGKKAKNQIYNIANSDPHTYKETYFAICDALEIARPKKQVPLWLANLAALMHETKCRLLGKRPKVTKMRASIARLVRNRIVSIDKAEKELGYKPKYGLEKGIKATVKTLRQKAVR